MSRGSPRWQIYCFPRRLQLRYGAGIACNAHKTMKFTVQELLLTNVGDDGTCNEIYARFQLEFNFRDAKQYWGLEDFMTVKQTPVYNSANLAMFMVNVSHAVIRPMRTQWPEFSVNDLKAWFRSRKYVVETLKLLPEMPDPIFIAQAIDQMAQLGRVNHVVNPV